MTQTGADGEGESRKGVIYQFVRSRTLPSLLSLLSLLSLQGNALGLIEKRKIILKAEG